MYVYKEWTGMLDLLKPYFMGLLKHLTDILTVSFFFNTWTWNLSLHHFKWELIWELYNVISFSCVSYSDALINWLSYFYLYFVQSCYQSINIAQCMKEVFQEKQTSNDLYETWQEHVVDLGWGESTGCIFFHPDSLWMNRIHANAVTQVTHSF